MWTVFNFSTYKRQFDFSSSEQGKLTYTALKADDEILINMIELFESDDNSTFQFIICENCGVTHCEPGNWLSIRKSGDFVLFIPAFNKILEADELNEYKPPNFFNTKGALILMSNQFQDLKHKVPAFANIRNLKTLSGFEAVSLYKWEAPHKMFGEYPNFKSLKADHILWTSELDGESISTIISDKLKTIATVNKAHLVPLDNLDEPVSIFLEGFTTVEWKAICKTPNGFELLIGNNYMLMTE